MFDLKKLQNDVNGIIDKMDPKDFHEAINWGDLSCYETVHCTNQDGEESYGILIEEAAPGCRDFNERIYSGLLLLGYDIVPMQINTEW